MSYIHSVRLTLLESNICAHAYAFNMIFNFRAFCKGLKHTSSSDLFLPPKVNPRLRVFLGRGKVLIITNPSRIISTIRVAPRFLHQVHQQGNKLGFIKRSLKACLKTLDMRHTGTYTSFLEVVGENQTCMSTSNTCILKIL